MFTYLLKLENKPIKQQKQFLKDKKSFGIETTFSGNKELRLMQETKDKGYKIKLSYKRKIVKLATLEQDKKLYLHKRELPNWIQQNSIIRTFY
jgi:hypothetical protein